MVQVHGKWLEEVMVNSVLRPLPIKSKTILYADDTTVLALNSYIGYLANITNENFMQVFGFNQMACNLIKTELKIISAM